MESIAGGFIIIRPALDIDFENIRELLDTHYRRDYFTTNQQLWRVITGQAPDRAERKPMKVWIAESGREIVGLIIVSWVNNTLINLFVHPDYRGQGIGRTLLAYLKPDVIRVKTDVTSGDPTDFYLKNGYLDNPYSKDDGSNIRYLEREDGAKRTLFSVAPIQVEEEP